MRKDEGGEEKTIHVKKQIRSLVSLVRSSVFQFFGRIGCSASLPPHTYNTTTQAHTQTMMRTFEIKLSITHPVLSHTG